MNRFNFIKTVCAIIVVLAVSCRRDPGETSAGTPISSDNKQQAPKSKSEQPMNYVTSKDGTKIAFEKSGTGPVIIIVSGALSARALFAGEPMLLVETLSKHFTVYIYDRRGRGESTDEQPYTVAREIDDLEALIDKAGGQAGLYGVSSGGALSLQAAARLGMAKVSKLAIYEVPYGQDKKTFDKQKQGVNERIKNGKPGDAAAFFLSEIGTPREALEKMKLSTAWRTIEKIDFTLGYDYQVLGDGTIPRDVVKTITIPTLVMVGEKGMDFMHTTTEQLARLMPNAEHKTLKGQLHQPKAEAVAPVLIDFFNK
ncbi:alpha/beta hydrolase [Fulvivirgaceae bacterium PWU4]|uniref:Alpha/beta hydrolase n=1 Tax=Chryseosolibacter histidini TaxID=2782349 RepID=A0AAP2DG21_9BACT|nr:alpha/beta hydrolase [Chryseosolibacter histidini]MBT1695550.1 alpha/beta hydrolase [Chryseosolibacter histidini]